MAPTTEACLYLSCHECLQTVTLRWVPTARVCASSDMAPITSYGACRSASIMSTAANQATLGKLLCSMGQTMHAKLSE